MKIRDFSYFVGDFETTVYQGQTKTEVWASAVVKLGTEYVTIFHSIDETFEFLENYPGNICIYYHNLKFDGAFWLDYLIRKKQFKQALMQSGESVCWQNFDDMENGSFQYSISDMGQWYYIKIKVKNKFIEIRDSLKLLPFSVKKIGKSFDTKHKKLDMEYKGFRYAGCEITEEEKEYIANDVLVIKEALELMFAEKHDKLTIGSCCLAEYKKIIGFFEYKRLFPNIYEYELDPNIYGSKNAGEYVRKSYKGGWCYLVKGKENQIKKDGTTADVNSLYPSMMSSESHNRYPIGLPTFWHGNYLPKMGKFDYYFIRIRTRFYLKDGKLPFIQIKGNFLYPPNECLETSDIYERETGRYHAFYKDFDGELKTSAVTLTLTMTDYELFREHYNVRDFEILDGCVFKTALGLFDGYIEKYKKIKMESKGAKRELAKLFLNNLYGKMASNTDSSFKIAYLKDDNSIGFRTINEKDKMPGYIPVGCAITSYARNFTIRTAQQNYYGADKQGFIYADTDSIHCDLPPEKIKGIKVHDKNFCCWKLESCWDIGLFVRQKTYIEHVTKEDLKECEPYYNVKCAGMPDRCKDLFIKSMQDDRTGDYTEEEKEFLKVKRDITDFKRGLVVPSKLMPKRIEGGIVLIDTNYEMR